MTIVQNGGEDPISEMGKQSPGNTGREPSPCTPKNRREQIKKRAVAWQTKQVDEDQFLETALV
jgi:hypothetical protein